MSYTKEPWSLDNYQRVKADGCNEFLGVQVDGFSLSGSKEAQSNSRRIVACVNACAGKETEDLEAMAGKDIFTGNLFSKRAATEKERDDLRKEYRKVIGERDTYRDLCGELLKALDLCNRNMKGQKVISFSSSLRIIESNSELITKAESILGEKK